MMPRSSRDAAVRTINGHRWIITIEGGEYVGWAGETEVRADNFRTFRIMICEATTALALSV